MFTGFKETPRTCKRVCEECKSAGERQDGRGEIYVVHKTEYSFSE